MVAAGVHGRMVVGSTAVCTAENAVEAGAAETNHAAGDGSAVRAGTTHRPSSTRTWMMRLSLGWPVAARKCQIRLMFRCKNVHEGLARGLLLHEARGLQLGEVVRLASRHNQVRRRRARTQVVLEVL
eukprot:1112461-Pleurochrysis_carterae.AAC.1